MRRSAATDSGWYDDRVLFVINPGHARDSRGRASSTPLRYRIQAIKNYAAHSCGCRGFRVGSPPETFDHSQFEYNGRPFTNHEPRATVFPRTQMRRSAGTDSGWYDDRALFVIHSGYAQDSRGRATCTPLRNRIQAIKNYAAHSCSCRGFRVGSPPAKFDHSQFEYNGRPFTNHESRFFLGLRCGIPPRQTQDGITTAYHWS